MVNFLIYLEPIFTLGFLSLLSYEFVPAFPLFEYLPNVTLILVVEVFDIMIALSLR